MNRNFQLLKTKSLVDLFSLLTDTLSAETTGSTDPVQVSLSRRRKIIVDDKRHLLNVDSSSPDIGRDQDSPKKRDI